MTIRTFLNHQPNIDDSAYIDPLALVCGQVNIGADSSLWPMAVARGDVQQINIGKRCNIQDGCVLHVTHDGPYTPGGFPLTLEDDITVGHQATLHACTIQHHCLIGVASVVMDGAVVEPYSLIGAGSLVPPGKTLEGGYLWRGSPVRAIRALTSKEKQSLDYSAQHYVKLARQHKQSNDE